MADMQIEPTGFDATFFGCLNLMVMTNVVATGNLDVKNVNVRKVAQNNPGYIYSKIMFAALIERLVLPKSTSLVYVKGVIVCMGTGSVAESLLACHKYVHLLRKEGILCRLVGFKPYNFVFSVMTFPLDLDKLARDYSYMVQYTDKFPGATIRCKHMNLNPPTNITIEAFHSGKLNITAATSEEEARRVFEHVYYSLLVHIRISPDNVREVDDSHLIEFDNAGGDFVKTITNVEHKKMIMSQKGKSKKKGQKHEIPHQPNKSPGSKAAAAAKRSTRNKKNADALQDDFYELSKISRLVADKDADEDQLLEAEEIVNRIFADGDEHMDRNDDGYVATLDDIMEDMNQFAHF